MLPEKGLEAITRSRSYPHISSVCDLSLITRNCQTGQISSQWKLLLKGEMLLSLAVNMDFCTTNPYPSCPSPRFGGRLGIHCMSLHWHFQLSFSKVILVLILALPSARQGMTTTEPSSLCNYNDAVWNWCSCTAAKGHCCLLPRSTSWGNIFSQLTLWFPGKVEINSLQWGWITIQTYCDTQKKSTVCHIGQ